MRCCNLCFLSPLLLISNLCDSYLLVACSVKDISFRHMSSHFNVFMQGVYKVG